MKIVIYPGDCFPFHGKTIEERPLGGTETAIHYVAKQLLEFGHEAIVVTPFRDPPQTIPRYVYEGDLSEIGDVDILIVVRKWQNFYLCHNKFKVKKRFFWTGDNTSVFFTYGIGDHRFIRDIDGLFGVSRWHTQSLCQTSGFPLYKTWVLNNGINPLDFEGSEVRHRKRLIYTSAVYRGLIYLPEIYRKLKQVHPDVELHIFSSYDRFFLNWASDYNPLRDVDNWKSYVKNHQIFDENIQVEPALQELIKMPGCVLHGSVLQKQLARELMKSSILAYPCNYEESSCITAMEAMAAGCAIVTTDIGALSETIRDGGILIKEKPGNPSYIDQYVKIVDRLLSDDAFLKETSSKAITRSHIFTWEKTVRDLLEYFRIVHELV